MTRTPSAALNIARQATSYKTGMCLQWVRLLYGIPAKYPDAATAWRNTKHRRTGTPPAGYPVWWTGGSRGFGHVAISDGRGYVYSTDVPSSGRVGRIAIATLTQRWGLTYRGWSLDINGVTLPAPSTGSSSTPSVSLSKIREAAKVDPPRASTKARYPTGTKRVEAALVKEGLLAKRYADSIGHFGSATVNAYAAWQRRLGYSGRDADGIPGKASLTKLGAKHGFRVTT